jgi:ElaB/YqjD/DUF883 family membrane-anchored ribosome-binding protein
MSTDQQQHTTAEPTHGLRETARDLAGDSKAAIEEAIERATEATRSTLIKQPTTGAAIAGAVGIAAAVAFGAVEAVLGGAAVYAAYRLLRRRKEHKESAAH